MRVFFLILLAVVVAGTPIANQQNPPRRIIDLNGLWKDNERLVGIGQTDEIVIGMFKQPYTKCDPENGSPPQDRVKDFEGTLKGNTITGKMTVCNYGKSWGANAGVQEVDVTLVVSDDQQTLTGQYKGYKGLVDVTLTRECTPDARTLCDAIGRAVQAINVGLAAPASASHYQSVQQRLGQELRTIRNNLCDKPEDAGKVDELQQRLDSLNYVPGQSNYQNNLALSAVDHGLKELSNSQCSAFNPPPPPSCAEGSDVKSEADTTLLNAFNKPLQIQLPARVLGGRSKTIACLNEMFGQTCAPRNVVADLRTVADTWGSAAMPQQDLCRRMCQSLGDWYAASPCSQGAFPKTDIVNKCIFVCRYNDFTAP
jgi:hypothetical protein